jgi:hypothetical protein
MILQGRADVRPIAVLLRFVIFFARILFAIAPKATHRGAPALHDRKSVFSQGCSPE